MLYEQREYMKKKLVVLLTVRIILWRFFITYLVGIDIAKYKHDCFIHDHNGEVIRHSFTFVNNRNGFNQLLLILKFFDKNQKIKIGFEATGHYGSSLKQFLKAYNFDFMEINSFLIKQFSKASTLRKTKTDKIDSVLIP